MVEWSGKTEALSTGVANAVVGTAMQSAITRNAIRRDGDRLVATSAHDSLLGIIISISIQKVVLILALAEIQTVMS